jgi:L-rhamnonate dehydratase
MKIKRIEVFRLEEPAKPIKTPQRRAGWAQEAEVANPMSKFAHVKRHRSLWTPPWGDVWCKVTSEDGSFGLGQTGYGRPVAAVIEDHLAPRLIGEDCLATDRLSDMMFRLTKPYGSVGLASYAISAVDLALWDLKGKLLGQPVYKLLGGASRDKIFCYATGNDVDWYKELGFRAFKLACPYGPADGLDGLEKNAEFVAQARAIIGDQSELMLDCWMAFDVEYTVRLAEKLRPYKLKWLEECLIPEDFDAHLELRQRLPWQTLATGEHWYSSVPFQWAASRHALDILQPDINWCGGVTVTQQVVAAAQASGASVILHAGGHTAFGQHFSFGQSAIPWCEFFVGSAPGVPLEEGRVAPGQKLPSNGWLTPNDAPGFGLEIPEAQLVPFFAP